METMADALPTQSPAVATPSKPTPGKARSLSDPANAPAALQPSPTFHERMRRESKDDTTVVPLTPRTRTASISLRRPELLVRGLSLQMPTGESLASSPRIRASPLSPHLDQHNIYMQSQSQQQSPATSLPRHSRGLDFARACTNLHHSTSAQQGSQPTSPIMTNKGLAIPGRKMSIGSMALDSPQIGAIGSGWGLLNPEKSTVSSSVGSVNMLASESDTDSSDEDASMAGDDGDDSIFTTPQVHKLQNPNAPTPYNSGYGNSGLQSPGAWGTRDGSATSPAAASLMKTIRRTRMQNHHRTSRKSSSSASNSGYSSMASPRTASPPPVRSIEGVTAGGGYFGWKGNPPSRRQSLALGTDGLNLSSGNDSGDEASHPPTTPGVVRRAVTRRGNLLPKTKGFARIRAALAEEAAPIDTEVRREAETIRQVRERDNSLSEYSLEPDRPQTATTQSSPTLLPAVPESAQEDFGKDLDLDNTPNPFRNVPALAFKTGAPSQYSAFGGLTFPTRFERAAQTPPPFFPRHSSSVVSDVNMESPATDNSTPAPQALPGPRLRAASSASDMTNIGDNPPPNTNGNAVSDDMHLQRVKRRREDDYDIATIKRRAVSPGMSAQNSPVLTQSPNQKDNLWGLPPEKRGKDASSADSDKQPQWQQIRSGSSGSNGSGVGAGALSSGMVGQGKKLGLQGMVDTNDGLMKMSIE